MELKEIKGQSTKVLIIGSTNLALTVLCCIILVVFGITYTSPVREPYKNSPQNFKGAQPTVARLQGNIKESQCFSMIKTLNASIQATRHHLLNHTSNCTCGSEISLLNKNLEATKVLLSQSRRHSDNLSKPKSRKLISGNGKNISGNGKAQNKACPPHFLDINGVCIRSAKKTSFYTI